MKLYRFSPITDENELFLAIKHIHNECYKLCFGSFGYYLPNSGNIGVFCHYDDEYKILSEIRKSLTEPSEDPNQKYFKLHNPIVIEPTETTPGATYTHLYIRKPDPYRHHVGDIDFYLAHDEYASLKNSLANGIIIPGARIFPRNDLDMIELYNPDVDTLAYISTSTMTEKVKKKLSNETNL